jgi:hypothetical protein
MPEIDAKYSSKERFGKNNSVMESAKSYHQFTNHKSSNISLQHVHLAGSITASSSKKGMVGSRSFVESIRIPQTRKTMFSDSSDFQVRQPLRYVPSYHNWKPLHVQLQEKDSRKKALYS